MEKENMPIVIVTVLAYYPFRTYLLASYAIPLVLYHYLLPIYHNQNGTNDLSVIFGSVRLFLWFKVNKAFNLLYYRCLLFF